MRITSIISTAIEKGKLICKVLGMGSKDVQTVYNILPFGIDSNPSKKIRAIWAQTESLEDRILLGILFERPATLPGETRIYSEDANGNEVLAFWFKQNGTCEMGGNSDNLVKYSKLDDGLQAFKDKVNTELGKIAVGITGAGGSYTPVPTSIDISDAKSDILKTI